MKKLYRHLDSFEAAIKHMQGELWLHTFCHFRKIEDKVRQDEGEGRASGQIKDGLFLTLATEKCPSRPTYILCFSECERAPDFGQYTIILRDSEALRARVLAALPEGSNGYFLPVIYSDAGGYDRRPGPAEICERKERTKPTRFSGECEWRLIVLLPSRFKIQNRRLMLAVGDLDGIFTLAPCVTPA
jgi:hypothetical protein